jgi:hypothetical protein
LAQRNRQAVLVTEDELAEFLVTSPKFYHMAEFKSWPSIKARGLLSTTAILDLYGVAGAKRVEIEETRRPKGVTLTHASLKPITIRDQIPMSDDALRKCLLDGLQPADWYRLLNQRVFFWPSEERLLRLLGAKAYRDREHDVLEVDASALVEDYSETITLSPINSGSTLFNPRLRGSGTFARIPDYQYAQRPKNNRVAEIAIDHSVPNMAKYVTRVVEMKGADKIRELKI